MDSRPPASASRVQVEEIFVLSGSTKLQCRLHTSTNASDTRLAIVSHPLGMLGGSQDDHVVQSVVRELVTIGWKVVSYNARGVGKSGGWPSLTFNAEADDYQAIVDHFVATMPTDKPLDLLLAGYSAGSLPASCARAPPGRDIRQLHCLISYPLIFGTKWPLRWIRSGRFDAALASLDTPTISFHSLHDEFSSISAYRDWSFAGKGNVTVREVDTSHFWSGGRTADLCRELRSWLQDQHAIQ